MSVFIFDLDGTLLNSNVRMSQNNIDSIKKLIEMNHFVIIASGRMYSSTMYIINTYLPFLKNISPVISYNGAYVHNHHHESLFESGVNKDTSYKIIDTLREENIHRQIYLEDKLISESDNEEIKSYAFHASVPYFIVPDLKQAIMTSTHKATKLLAVNSDRERLLKLRDLLNSEYKDITAMMSFRTYLDIVPKDSSKGLALEKLSEYYKFKLNETYIFGDSENDLSMLNLTKFSVAMGNASEDVKHKCKLIAPTNDEDGVSYVIEKILNGNFSFNFS